MRVLAGNSISVSRVRYMTDPGRVGTVVHLRLNFFEVVIPCLVIAGAIVGASWVAKQVGAPAWLAVVTVFVAAAAVLIWAVRRGRPPASRDL